MSIVIREANKKDHQEIKILLDESYGVRSKDEYGFYSDSKSCYYETIESTVSKIDMFPQGALVADLDGVIGCVISFPYYVGKTFPINTDYRIFKNPNCWYVHYVCVLNRFKKKGVATSLIKNILVNSWNVVALTAIQDTTKFWQKFGFLSFKKVEYCGKKSDYMMLIK